MANEPELLRRKAQIADALVNSLLVDGVNLEITLEDIELLTQPGKKPKFMREIVAELLVCLRPK